MLKWFKKMRARRIQDETLRGKTLANIDNEPWISVVDVGFENPGDPKTGYFELDWNQAFVQKLVEAGYSGRTDEMIVDMWFDDLCRGVLKQEPE